MHATILDRNIKIPQKQVPSAEEILQEKIDAKKDSIKRAQKAIAKTQEEIVSLRRSLVEVCSHARLVHMDNVHFPTRVCLDCSAGELLGDTQEDFSALCGKPIKTFEADSSEIGFDYIDKHYDIDERDVFVIRRCKSGHIIFRAEEGDNNTESAYGYCMKCMKERKSQGLPDPKLPPVVRSSRKKYSR